MHDRNGKSERILTKLGVDVPGYTVILLKEPPNFARKYFLKAELFIFEYR